MKLAEGITTEGLRPEIKRAFTTIDTVYLIHRQEAKLLVAITEKDHYSKYHGMGLAIDITLPTMNTDGIVMALECRLGSQYKIERYHNKLHIAYVGTISEGRHH